MALKLRKGVIVYAQKDLTSTDIFPSDSTVLSVFIKKGTKGKVTDASDEELPVVKFDSGHEWSVDVDHVGRRKPK